MMVWWYVAFKLYNQVKISGFIPIANCYSHFAFFKPLFGLKSLYLPLLFFSRKICKSILNDRAYGKSAGRENCSD